MNSLFCFIYRGLFKHKSQQRFRGFTLIELLVSLIVASLVVTGLLSVVVELTKIDKREATLDQVQRDMSRAMDYISDDLQEAVYVYPNPQRIANELSSDSAFPGGTGEVPVLAFWRIDPIEEGIPTCDPAATNFELCQVLKIRQAAYTLVVYVQKANDGSNNNWSGQSRLIRYELSKYSDLSNLTVRDGYRDPTDSTDASAPFEVWTAKGTPDGFAAVLVDFVQTPSPSVAFNRAPLSDANAPCYGYGTDNATPTANALYTIVPNNASTTVNNSFFACVRSPDPDNDPLTVTRTNQDVYVFLRGSVQGVAGGVSFFSEESSLPILETRVLVKGIIDKDI